MMKRQAWMVHVEKAKVIKLGCTLKATYLLVGLYRDKEEGICFLSSTVTPKQAFAVSCRRDFHMVS